MERIRIYQLARELSITSRELLAYLSEIGRSETNHLAMVEETVAARARIHFVLPAVDSAPVENGQTIEPLVLDFDPYELDAPESAPLESFEEPYLVPVESRPWPRSALASAGATTAAIVAPAFVAFSVFVFGQPHPRILLAGLVSVVLTLGALVLGSLIWATQPESDGFAFGDLMFWSWVRREWAERRLVENTAVLGFDRSGRSHGFSTASAQQQMLAVREIATALDAKSSYTIGHSRRVQKLCRKVAEALGLDERQTEALSLAASLHDIGNISIPDDVLRKAGELTIDERSKIEAHVLLGARMVLKAGSDDVVDGIRHHHERWDGGGYPEGLQGEEIPLYARIIGIAEAYDAMTSTRPYRQGLSRQDAIGVLRSEADRQFDHDIVEVFVSTLPEPLAVFRRFPFLAKIQRQFEELGLVFKRMGAVAVSATASTIAIALILGSTVLTPGTGGDAPAMAAPQRRIRPIDRVLASRIDETTAVLTNYHVNDMYGIDVSVGSGATVNDDGETLVAALDGSDVKFGDTIVVPGDDGSGGGNTGGGSGGGTGGGGGGTDIPGPIEGGGGVDRGEGGGTGGGGGGGTTDGGGNTGGGGTTDGGGIDGGTVPPPTTDGDPTHGKDHDKTGNGNSDNAPGHNKDDGTTGSGNGNSDNAPGHNKDDGTTGSGNGNSDNAPGHNKDDTGTGSTDGPPVVTPPPGNGNGNGNGKTDNPPADNGSGNGNGGGPSDGWAHDGSNGNGNPDPSAGGDTPKDNGNSDKSDNGNGNDKKTDPPPSVDPGPSPDSDNGKGNDKKTDVTADETTSTPSPSPSGGNGNGKGPKVEAGTATT